MIRYYSVTAKATDGWVYPDPPVAMKLDPYEGISQSPFNEKISLKLMEPINKDDIEIRPDGVVYLPEIKYRRILNQAFGPGGWALMPRAGTAVITNSSFSREYALFCLGRFVAQARGESDITSYSTVGVSEESAKSNALLRCCKDLGVASELWDHTFVNQWKEDNTVEMYLENSKTGEVKKFWKKKNFAGLPLGFPWRQQTKKSTQSAAAPAQTATPTAQAAQPAQTSQPAAQPAAQTSQPTATPTAQPTQPVQSTLASLNETVPTNLTKYSGKTWGDVVKDQAYAKFLLQSGNEHTKNLLKQALALHQKMIDYELAEDKVVT